MSEGFRNTVSTFTGQAEGLDINHEPNVGAMGQSATAEYSLQAASISPESLTAQSPLDHADKLQLLGRASAMLAHELRNPLGSMRLFASLVRDDLRQASIPTTNLDQIEKGIERIDSIIGQVLSFARVQRGQGGLRVNEDLRGQGDLLNLHSIIQEQGAEIKRLYPKMNIRLILKESPFLAGDQILLAQLVANLLKNGAEAMHGAGEISISDIESDQRYLRLTFCDSGPGIRAEEQERIFEPFYTTKKQGTGLGLALVREVARQHGGDVSCLPREGGGCFQVVLARVSNGIEVFRSKAT